MSLKQSIVIAWRILPFQVSGGPPWRDSVRYDIVAKPETRPKQDEMPRMLQALLKDRFQLVVHRETKEPSSVFSILFARSTVPPPFLLSPGSSPFSLLPPEEHLLADLTTFSFPAARVSVFEGKTPLSQAPFLLRAARAAGKNEISDLSGADVGISRA